MRNIILSRDKPSVVRWKNLHPYASNGCELWKNENGGAGGAGFCTFLVSNKNRRDGALEWLLKNKVSNDYLLTSQLHIKTLDTYGTVERVFSIPKIDVVKRELQATDVSIFYVIHFTFENINVEVYR